MSNELKAMFVWLQQWIDAGFPENRFGIDKGFGLCQVVNRWEISHGYLGPTKGLLKEELKRFFDGKLHPFNNTSGDFIKEAMDGRHYENPKRLAFIKEHSQ